MSTGWEDKNRDSLLKYKMTFVIDLLKQFNQFNMKQLFALVLALVTFSAFAQTDFQVSAGGTYNYVKSHYSEGLDVKNPFGAYGAVSVRTKVTEKLYARGTAIFMNQHAEIEKVDVDVNTIGAAFSFDYYLTNKLKVLVGMHGGIIVSESDEKGILNFNAGAGYDIGRFEILAKYYAPISTSAFVTSTLGVGYRFSK